MTRVRLFTIILISGVLVFGVFQAVAAQNLGPGCQRIARGVLCEPGQVVWGSGSEARCLDLDDLREDCLAPGVANCAKGQCECRAPNVTCDGKCQAPDSRAGQNCPDPQGRGRRAALDNCGKCVVGSVCAVEGQVQCDGQCQALAQPGESACQAQGLAYDTCKGCVGCAAGFIDCDAGAGFDCRSAARPADASCPATQVWDACTRTCSDYVQISPTAAQSGYVHVQDDIRVAAGNLRLEGTGAGQGDVILNSGKAVQLRGATAGAARLNLGSWEGQPTQLVLHTSGAQQTSEILFSKGQGGLDSTSKWALSLRGDSSNFEIWRNRGGWGRTPALSVSYETGSVGIGTTTPTERLDVAGNARVGGNLRVEGTVNGVNLSQAVLTGGSYANPAWLTSLAWSKFTGFPAACPAGQFATALGGTLTCAAPPTPELARETDPNFESWRGARSGAVLDNPLLAKAGLVVGEGATAARITPSGDLRLPGLEVRDLAGGAGRNVRVDGQLDVFGFANFGSQPVRLSPLAQDPTRDQGYPAGSFYYNTRTNELRVIGASGQWSAVGGVTSHGALSGLGSNDHPQYYLQTGDARALAVGGALTVSGTVNGVNLADALLSTSAYVNPAWLTALAWGKLTGFPAACPAGQFVTSVAGTLTCAAPPAPPPAPEVITDHGALSGLADNDHPQYYLQTGDTRALEVGGALGVGGGLTVGQNARLARGLTVQGNTILAGALTALSGDLILVSPGRTLQFNAGGRTIAVQPLEAGELMIGPFGPGAGGLDAHLILNSGVGRLSDLIFSQDNTARFALALRSAPEGNDLQILRNNQGWSPALTVDYDTGNLAVAGTINGVNLSTAVLTTENYANPAWLTGLAWNKLAGFPAACPSGQFVTSVAGTLTCAAPPAPPPAPEVITDHGALTGLGDNDHPQYYLQTGDVRNLAVGGALTVAGPVNDVNLSEVVTRVEVAPDAREVLRADIAAHRLNLALGSCAVEEILKVDRATKQWRCATEAPEADPLHGAWLAAPTPLPNLNITGDAAVGGALTVAGLVNSVNLDEALTGLDVENGLTSVGAGHSRKLGLASDVLRQPADCAANQILQWNGSRLSCINQPREGIVYSAGDNIIISGTNAISVNSTPAFARLTVGSGAPAGAENGDLGIAGDLYLTSGNKIRVDGRTTRLDVGNYAGAQRFTLGVRGQLGVDGSQFDLSAISGSQSLISGITEASRLGADDDLLNLRLTDAAGNVVDRFRVSRAGDVRLAGNLYLEGAGSRLTGNMVLNSGQGLSIAAPSGSSDTRLLLSGNVTADAQGFGVLVQASSGKIAEFLLGDTGSTRWALSMRSGSNNFEIWRNRGGWTQALAVDYNDGTMWIPGGMRLLTLDTLVVNDEARVEGRTELKDQVTINRGDDVREASNTGGGLIRVGRVSGAAPVYLRLDRDEISAYNGSLNLQAHNSSFPVTISSKLEVKQDLDVDGIITVGKQNTPLITATGALRMNKLAEEDFDSTAKGMLILGARTGYTCSEVCDSHKLDCYIAYYVDGTYAGVNGCATEGPPSFDEATRIARARYCWCR